MTVAKGKVLCSNLVRDVFPPHVTPEIPTTVAVPSFISGCIELGQPTLIKWLAYTARAVTRRVRKPRGTPTAKELLAKYELMG